METADKIPVEAIEAILDENSKKAHGIFSELAKKGDANAEHYMGWFYEQGLVVNQSDTKAFEWWPKSAQQGIV